MTLRVAQQQGMPADTPPERQRRGRLWRAAVGTVVLLLLAAALWGLDAEEAAPPPAPTGVAKTPAAGDAPPPAPPALVSAPAVSQVSAGTIRVDPPTASSPATDAAPAQGPGPTDAAAATAADAGAPDAAVPATAAPPAVFAPQTPAAGPAALAASPTPSASAPPGPGFLLQLGVFLDTGNAELLRRELAAQGYPAHLQSRVVLGPYPDRKAVLAAQEKVRRERKLDGMILPPRKP